MPEGFLRHNPLAEPSAQCTVSMWARENSKSNNNQPLTPDQPFTSTRLGPHQPMLR